MRKQKKLFVGLILVVIVLFNFVSASCSDVDLEITGLNMKYNFMKGVINSGETQIKEIRVYLDGESKMTDKSENFNKDIFFPSFKEPLSIGQEIRIDIILDDGTVCKDKEILIVSENKIMASTPECDANKKKRDWCEGDFVMGTRCNNGEWEEFIDVDCSYWGGTCKNAKCVEIENENKIINLIELDNSSEKIEELNPELQGQELMQTQVDENFSPEEPSENFITKIFNWIVNIFKI